MRRFFIVGCPRSGTTLLQQILARHPEVVAPPETAFFTKLLSRWPGRFRRQLERIEADLGIDLSGACRPRDAVERAALFDRIASAYSAVVGRPNATWVGDKTPDHLQHVDAIAETLPDARLISVHRDGRDVALSLSRVPWAPQDVLVDFGIWLAAARRQLELARRSDRRLLTVRYEDLVASPRTELGRILRHLELDERDDLLDGAEKPQGVPDWERGWKDGAHRPVSADRVGVWKRELDPRQVEAMERWGGNELGALGYEVSERRPDGAAPIAARVRWALWRLKAGAALLIGRG